MSKRIAVRCGLILLLLAFCSGCSYISNEPTVPEIHIVDSGADDSSFHCAYNIVAPEEAIRLQITVTELFSGSSKILLSGGISIGEERVPMRQIVGCLSITANCDALSLTMDCFSSGTAKYAVPIVSLSPSFDTTFEFFPISPTLDEPIQLATMQSRTSDRLISVEIIFHGEDTIS